MPIKKLCLLLQSTNKQKLYTMKNINEVTTGQIFTNGTTDTQWLKLDGLDAKNMSTGNVKTFAVDVIVSVIDIEAERIYTDYKGNVVELTANEKEIIELLDEEIFEYGTIVYLDQLETSFSTKIGRGVLSSLIKKNVCVEVEGMLGYSMDKYKG